MARSNDLFKTHLFSIQKLLDATRQSHSPHINYSLLQKCVMDQCSVQDTWKDEFHFTQSRLRLVESPVYKLLSNQENQICLFYNAPSRESEILKILIEKILEDNLKAADPSFFLIPDKTKYQETVKKNCQDYLESQANENMQLSSLRHQAEECATKAGQFIENLHRVQQEGRMRHPLPQQEESTPVQIPTDFSEEDLEHLRKMGRSVSQIVRYYPPPHTETRPTAGHPAPVKPKGSHTCDIS